VRERPDVDQRRVGAPAVGKERGKRLDNDQTVKSRLGPYWSCFWGQSKA
jgi:hypothetical protein